MRRLRIKSLSTILLTLLAAQPGLRAETKSEAPDFKEVYDVIRAHLGGMSEEELNRKAVRGLVSALGPMVSFVSNGDKGNAASEGPALGQTNVFDGDIAYLRVRRVDGGLAKAVADACEKLHTTNQMRGVVLDLRYAGGADYAAAAATAELFVKKSRPLLDWGEGPVRSKEKTDAIAGPIAVLVNGQTAGGAEALAGVLRQAGAALILGSKTAGQAMIAQEFPLRNGDRLRIGTTPVKLGDGSAISGQGLAPDITVEVSVEDDRAYYMDAFRDLPRANLAANTVLSLTNGASASPRPTRRPRFNEAELIRERKVGASLDSDAEIGKDVELESPSVRDPVLSRALDVLKGLAVVRHSRS
jgi:hypothetical protein